MSKLKTLLIDNEVIAPNVTGDTFLLTEKFLELLQDKIVNSDCIINHIPSYDIAAKKAQVPVLSQMTFI